MLVDTPDCECLSLCCIFHLGCCCVSDISFNISMHTNNQCCSVSLRCIDKSQHLSNVVQVDQVWDISAGRELPTFCTFYNASQTTSPIMTSTTKHMQYRCAFPYCEELFNLDHEHGFRHKSYSHRAFAVHSLSFGIIDAISSCLVLHLPMLWLIPYELHE